MFNPDEIHAITRKISSVDKYLPTGLTKREYALLALACIDQTGAKKETFDRVLQVMEVIDVWEEDETCQDENIGSDGPPYDAATATGMYDHW